MITIDTLLVIKIERAEDENVCSAWPFKGWSRSQNGITSEFDLMIMRHAIDRVWYSLDLLPFHPTDAIKMLTITYL